MKIIILGAGQVGKTLAENLAIDGNDITMVDQNKAALKDLQDRLDIRTIAGPASLPSILEAAGVEDADMLVAVTNTDEVNMVACQIAKHVYLTPTTISRIRSHQYLHHRGALFKTEKGAFPIDVIISPEKLVTKHVQRLIENPSALQVLDFAEGRVQLVAVKARIGGPLVGQPIANLRQHMPNIDTRVAAIFRKDRAIVPEGDTEIHVDDEVFFIAAKRDIRAVMSELRRLEKPYKKIMIAGGGNIGARLASNLAKDFRVKIIERGLARCEQLADSLDDVIVLHGSASDQDLLIEENIEATDVFCALTNDDEANIMASMLAKRLGVRNVMTLISNPAYVDLIEDGTIDIAISPQQATVSSLLTHVRRGDIVNVHSLRRGAAEAIEVIAHGDLKTSQVVGRRLEQIALPEGTSFGALVRGDKVIMAHHDTVIENDDHVILFLTDRRMINDVERLFAVALTFF
ncbi:MAG: Trk system potassium transporter TrkA [Gammaproteobacteria bacterium]|nr:Trk system potassium transporter TrkA [Gammaproteobacteria bacterium]MCP4880581.1 Trk system potassium transporter TrkA [Gammaproteobacteria bacterium]MDP6165207.1 Trk system potassium transporter TrkA [Gammaproteobacteria bacterium]